MEDREFFDLLYQHWSKTTGAHDTYWMPEEDESFPGLFSIIAVGKDESRKPVASFLKEEDADFITAMHGCLADLVRKLNDALDEADRADYDKDSRECRMAELELENAELRRQLNPEGTK
ncbi:hypothetical protein M041_gp51 [Mycobacterium phage Severus]|uniref:hypothetical protein n=1 Tax=Mycobacterium phage Severus TaxID=1327776 RepID=UPI00032B7D27|nr:hypothetical protein M041_gp51 [Mycobacterium phage Severus]YP_009124954.1 hypothetical protein VC70_gp36 [Mycobacterium phage Trike]AGK87968.1 hypothetical protein PBI_SEVERUS_36 [Mycobacterium phage Severus]AIK69074.1 hypothetical protein PBI_TRIKE_35 [Mycobacterium phage Trike]QZD97020.1 hypothetical protein SEA_DRAKE94_36 [Mycobacterium phage Drake94]